MTISMDKKYRTRDGRDVRLLCVDGPGDWPVVGIIDGSDMPDCWTAKGGWADDGALEDVFDLIEYHEPDIRTIWVNVYPECVVPYANEVSAKMNAESGCIAIAQPVTFEVKRT